MKSEINMETISETKAFGFTGQQLKTIAIVAMFIDHAAGMFIKNYYSPLGILLHFIGRITAPIMFYLLVEGYHHTKNKNKYTLRMLVFALISYFPFIFFKSFASYGTWSFKDVFLYQSVIYTLFLDLLMLRVIHEVRSVLVKCVLVVILLLLSTFGDWGYTGMFIVLVFDLLRGNFAKQAVGYSVVVGMLLLRVINGWTSILQAGNCSLENITANSGYILVQMGLFLPLIFLYAYNGERGKGERMSKWGFYIFYPLHLIVLVLLKQVFVWFGMA